MVVHRKESSQCHDLAGTRRHRNTKKFKFNAPVFREGRGRNLSSGFVVKNVPREVRFLKDGYIHVGKVEREFAFSEVETDHFTSLGPPKGKAFRGMMILAMRSI